MRFGIREKVACVILLCMVPVLIAGVRLYADQDRERRDAVLHAQEDAAQAVAADVEMFVANIAHAELAAGSAVESQPYPLAGITHLFGTIRANDPSFLWLGLARPDGHVEASDPAGDPRANLMERPAFDAARVDAPWAARGIVTVTGRSSLEVASRISVAGRLTAVVDGVVNLEAVRPEMATDVAPEMDGMIVDGAGRTVLDLRRGDRPSSSLRSLPAVRAALAGQVVPITGYADPRTGVAELGAAAPIPTLGWAAIVLEPEAVALQPVQRAAQVELAWFLGAVLCGLGLAWTLGGGLSAPILALARGARALGRGETEYRVALRRQDELGELGAAFDEMSERLGRSMSEMNALQAVSDAALSTVRLDDLLPTLVQQIAAALGADGGTVWFIDETTGRLGVPVGVGGGSASDAGREPGAGLAGRVADGGRPLALSGPDALRVIDPALLADGARAALGVPLRVGGRVIGVILVLSRLPREFRAREIGLLEAFADRVALAVDNARAYERQQEIAGVIQQALVPTSSVELPGVIAAGRYLPSREVGGDFYAIFPLARGQVGLAIADVTGKGIPAAALSARGRYLLEAFALDGRPPETVLARMNAVLTQDAASALFVTLFYAVVDAAAGTLRCTCAGHPAPLLLRHGASDPRPLDARGLLLGVSPDARYAATELTVHPGDLLLLFTDGITEARNADGEEFGEERLGALLVAGREAPPQDIADRIMRAVGAWGVAGPKDDQALVVARVLPWYPTGVGERGIR
ncbi:MAG TPA: SpoIIE family protein phosphatase [bacterium]|nr:SpoIIE family protein phosphatase [bacterium]